MFKDRNNMRNVRDLKCNLDKLCVLETKRSVQVPGYLFNPEVCASEQEDEGWFVGLLFGMRIYSSVRLPIKLTTKERLEKLEEQVCELLRSSK